jgi:uncharacterized protein (DUF488 family)
MVFMDNNMLYNGNIIWTVGHSTHSYERFLSLLKKAGITAIADVRTVPHSRHLPHFNRDHLKQELKVDGIAYSFLGGELGGRPKGSHFYCNGVADYERMAIAPDFISGLDRVIEGARKFRVALMCSEHDPLDCHRCLLVGRALGQRNLSVEHIYSDGRIASNTEIEQRLLTLSGAQDSDLFLPPDQQLAVAYRNQARKVAFVEPTPALGASVVRHYG